MNILRKLLWIDCCAGFLAGIVMLSLAGWLSELYAVPYSFMIGMGLVNLAYASFSCWLAIRKQRPLVLIMALAVANTTWGVLCWAMALLLVDTASLFGLGHLVAEGLFVGGLGLLEWQQREQLRMAG